MKLLSYLHCLFRISMVMGFSIQPAYNLFNRHIRNAKEAKECIQMEHMAGKYKFSSTGSQQVCGFYMIGKPNQVVQIEVTDINVNCDVGGLVAIFDGWSINDQYFPSPGDHHMPFLDRFSTCCGVNRPTKRYLASQNVAMVQYFIPTQGQGFSIKVNFVDSLQPCNILSMASEGMFTLRNYGKRTNCTVYIMSPGNLQLIALDVGQTSQKPRPIQETGTKLMCEEEKSSDYLQLLTGNGMNPATMWKLIDVCGLDSSPLNVKFPMTCQNTAIRMVSGGHYYNAVTFAFSKLVEKQIRQYREVTC